MRIAASILGVAIVAGVASADSVYLQHTGHTGNYGKTVTATLSNGFTFEGGSTQKSVWAGLESYKADDSAFKSFVCELTQNVGTDTYDFMNLTDSMSADKAGLIYGLFNSTNRGADANTNTKAAAFQALIWEIVYDYNGNASSLALGAGNVRFSGVSGTQFSNYKNMAMGGLKSASVIALNSDSKGDAFRIVPLPSAAGMAGLGLLALASTRRRQA